MPWKSQKRLAGCKTSVLRNPWARTQWSRLACVLDLPAWQTLPTVNWGTVCPPPSIVFSWLRQLRVAPYSYDILDNLGRRSPRARDPQLVHLEVGQRFMTVLTLESFADDEQITLRSKGVAVTYAVRSEGAGTRLHVRVLFGGPRPIARGLALGDLVMMRKQLLTLKSLAERDAASDRPDICS